MYAAAVKGGKGEYDKRAQVSSSRQRWQRGVQQGEEGDVDGRKIAAAVKGGNGEYDKERKERLTGAGMQQLSKVAKGSTTRRGRRCRRAQ
jgi:hypothetical protein